MQGPPIVLLLMLACCGPALPQNADVKQQLDDQSARRDQVRGRIAGLQAEMQQTRGEHASLSARLAAAEREVGELLQTMSKLDQQRTVLKADLKVLRDKQSQEQALLRHEQVLLKRQLRSAYITGRQERLRILLNQQDPAPLARTLAYYDYLNRARAARMQEIQHRIDELGRLGVAISSRENELNRLKQERLTEKLALEQTQAERQKIISRLAQELVQSGAALEQLKQDEAQLNVLLKGIQRVLRDLDNPKQLPFRKVKGKLPWPARGRIKASFGSSKIGDLRWDGVIIAAPEGRELHAVHAGRVAYADWLRGYGLLLIIDHGDGYMSLYGHNQSLFKETGDWLETGDVIGLVGSSGAQSAAGIYFGIRHDGKAVNPARWCKKGRGKKVG
jgi:septal ring factor EnvC (AmiA/AmiB activator)